MDDHHVLFFMWLRDRKITGSNRGRLIKLLHDYADPYSFLVHLLANDTMLWEEKDYKTARQLLYEFGLFRLKPGANAYLFNRYYANHTMTFDDVKKHLDAKFSKPNGVKHIDWQAFYAGLLGIEPARAPLDRIVPV